MERLTFEGNFCDIAQCDIIPGDNYCESGSCTQRKVWERLTALEIGNPCAIMADAKRQIANTRDADVAPVVHAKWDENGYCTNCGKHAPFWSISSCYYKSPYCQSCGAKMDGGDDNEAD